MLSDDISRCPAHFSDIRNAAKFIAVPQIKLLQSRPAHDAVNAPAQVVVVRYAVMLPGPFDPY